MEDYQYIQIKSVELDEVLLLTVEIMKILALCRFSSPLSLQQLFPLFSIALYPDNFHPHLAGAEIIQKKKVHSGLSNG